jgi:hypothetical protein
MGRKLLALSSLLFVFACAAFNYKFYGVNTGGVPSETLTKISLIAGQRNDKNTTLDFCRLTNGESLAKCIMVPTDEFRLMREEIIKCRGESK